MLTANSQEASSSVKTRRKTNVETSPVSQLLTNDMTANPDSPQTLPSPTMSPLNVTEDSRIVVAQSFSSLEQSLTSLPHLIQAFDTFPPQMQTCLLAHLLQRSSASTLQIVSRIVLPALKRDFIGLLPVELSYQIFGYLDLRTLGRCQAVSGAWNIVINSHQAGHAIWKTRLVKERFANDEEISRVFAKAKQLYSNGPSASHFHSTAPDPVRRKLRLTGFNKQSSKSVPSTNLDGTTSPSDYVPSKLYNRNIFKRIYKRHVLIRRNWFTGKYKQTTFAGHGSSVVTCLQFDTDRIVSGSDDESIHIYRTSDGEQLRVLEGHRGGVWALQYVGNTLVSGSTDRTVRVWDMETGECTHVFEGHTSTIRCLLILEPQSSVRQSTQTRIDHPVIVTGSRDSTVRIWRLPDIKQDMRWPDTATPASPSASIPQNPFLLNVLKGHSNSVRALAGSANILVTGSYDCTVRVWSIDSGECLHVYRGHREKVYSVGYCHELERAVSGSMDSTVKIWCTSTGAALHSLEGHVSLVGLLELSPKYLVSAAADGTLRIWSPLTGQCLSNMVGHAAAITCVRHDPKFNRIVSGSDGGVKIWELSSCGYGANETGGSSLNGVVPGDSHLGRQITFTQGANGPEPIYGRFIQDVVTQVQGVWRVQMDETRLVCAVQREDGTTWFEVLDFGHVEDEDVLFL